MPSSTPTSFTEAGERLALHHELQSRRAAETVRAHVAPDEVAALLDCLGLGDAVEPLPL